MVSTRFQQRLQNPFQDKPDTAESPKDAIPKTTIPKVTNPNTLLCLPTEIILEIASHLYGDARQIYVFTKRPQNLGWHLLIRALLPSPETSNTLPCRYGCRTIFPIRPLLNDPTLHTDRIALAAAHPHFAAVLKRDDTLPWTLPAKPIEPAPLEVWVERLVEMGTFRMKRKKGKDREVKEMGVRACMLEEKFWLVENTTDEDALEGWGMVWMEGCRCDERWPKGIPRVGIPEPRGVV